MDNGIVQIKIAIIDDDILAQKNFSDRITPILNEHRIGYQLVLMDDTIQFSELESVDLVFLDIDMPTISGFDFAKKLHSIYPEIVTVFITANNHLVYDSFEYHPFDFICKDMNQVILNRKFTRILNYFFHQFISCKHNGRDFYLKKDNILYFEKFGKNLHIHYLKKELIIRVSLAEILHLLNECDNLFFMIHRSIVVNLKHVDKIQDGHVYLNNSVKLPISRTHYRKFNVRYEKYVKAGT